MSIAIDSLAPYIAVFDMPISLAFYRDVLGFTITNQSSPGDETDWCMLSLDGVVLMLNTAYDRSKRPAAPDPARIKAHGDTTFYFGCRDVEAAYVHLRGKGIDVPLPQVSWYGMKQLYLKDPDGYLLCFQWAAE